MGELVNIKGIGPQIEKYFNNLGIYSTSDMLYFFPRDYDEYEDIINISELEVGKTATINATIVTKPSYFSKGRLKITSLWLDDGTGRIRSYWFNIPFINKMLNVGVSRYFRGRVSKLKDGIGLSQCKIYKKDDYESLKGSLSPIYSLTKGLSNNTMKKTLKSLLNDKSLCKNEFEEYIPEEFIKRNKLCDLQYAFNHIHFPNDLSDMQYARKRLVYDEFFLFSLAMLSNKNKNNEIGRGELKNVNESLLKIYIEKLPFLLTDGQKNALKEILSDFKSGKKMNRLLEGDVGSGKTIVAMLIAILVSEKKLQSAIMAPTEILAEQHYNTLNSFLSSIDTDVYKPTIALLTGSTKSKERKEILKKLELGEIDIIIGTHALFSDDVIYKDLAFCIVDEQHRFGVGQRKRLEDKSNNADVLIMSATPIPRTLAMLIYADMDISRILDKPKHQKEIKNYVANVLEREKAYRSIKKQIDLGYQAYVICPSIEKNDEEDIGSFANYQNVYDYAEKLKKFYGSKVKIDILHGKMKPEEKYNIMMDFKNKKIDILVATTVVEVGVDVPNATFMMVEDAGRFGLAELHQLRGRVGRGEAQSYALFVDTTKTENSKKRLNVLKNSNDGFYIAEEDLKLRGPGDIFGVKQSGDIEFKLADMYADVELFKAAGFDAKEFLDKKNKPSERLTQKLNEYIKMGLVI